MFSNRIPSLPDLRRRHKSWCTHQGKRRRYWGSSSNNKPHAERAGTVGSDYPNARYRWFSHWSLLLTSYMRWIDCHIASHIANTRHPELSHAHFQATYYCSRKDRLVGPHDHFVGIHVLRSCRPLYSQKTIHRPWTSDCSLVDKIHPSCRIVIVHDSSWRCLWAWFADVQMYSSAFVNAPERNLISESPVRSCWPNLGNVCEN